ncbi:hypothetical protein MMC29_007184 [Sticta canariensis]|nr:hypothetical protein [Sticta canariensis]
MSDQRKTVLITGCSPGGIGNALAREFHSKGLRVFATARNAETISDLSDLGIEVLSLEVHKAESVSQVREIIQQRTGGSLNYLVNNAGRNYTVPGVEINIDDVRELFETNVFAVMRMCQEFTPLLIEARGTIVQIGSVAGVIPYVFGSVYNASKAALHAYSNTLRLELAPFDVKVVIIVTGGVQSRIARTRRDLAEDSLYLPINDDYQRRLRHSQENAMPNEAYARSVISQVLQTTPKKWIWEGKSSWTIWWFHTTPDEEDDYTIADIFPAGIGWYIFEDV